MRVSIFMIFQFFGIISAWSVKALEDGKITATEGLELVIALAGLLGVKTEFDLSDYNLTATNTTDVNETVLTPDAAKPSRPVIDPSGRDILKPDFDADSLS